MQNIFATSTNTKKAPRISHTIYRVTIKEIGDRGSTVVKVLFYKSEGRWFDPSWCHWNVSLT